MQVIYIFSLIILTIILYNIYNMNTSETFNNIIDESNIKIIQDPSYPIIYNTIPTHSSNMFYNSIMNNTDYNWYNPLDYWLNPYIYYNWSSYPRSSYNNRYNNNHNYNHNYIRRHKHNIHHSRNLLHLRRKR